MFTFVPCTALTTCNYNIANGNTGTSITSGHNGEVNKARVKCCLNVDLSPPSSSSNRWNDTLSQLLNQPPRPVQLVRRPLEQEFAVLMMRSGYNAVDELDFVAMNDFQAIFFDIRSREWEKFVEDNRGIRQGNISEARYFDFISYAQMLTIQHFMRSPKVLFEEQYEVVNPGDESSGFETRVVKRDMQRYGTSEELLNGWLEMVGNGLYSYIIKAIRRPAPMDLSSADIVAKDKSAFVRKCIEEIYDYFYRVGFCLAIYWQDAKQSEGLGRVEVVGPCILWGNQALRKRRSIPNDYDCMCVLAFARRCGVSLQYSTSYSDNAVLRTWKIV